MGLIKDIDETLNEKNSDHEQEIVEVQSIGQTPKIDLTLMAKVNDDSQTHEIKQDEVNDVLNKAAKDADEEVETITFGLETDDGEIVKVYVNSEDADGFEEAMSKMLGLEDSIEAALEKLSVDFDIVAVDWPDDEEEDEETTGEEQPETDDLSDLTGGDESEEEPQNEGEDTMTIGNNFLKRILGEEQDLMEKKIKDEEDLESEEEEVDDKKNPIFKRFKFTTPIAKMILDIMMTLNVPKLVMIRNFSTVRNGIIESSRMVQKNPRAKMWLGRFNDGLKTMSDLSESKNIKDEVADVGVKKLSKQLFDVLVALGIPEDNFEYGKADIRKFFRTVSLAIQKNSRMRMILKNIHTALGLSDDEGNRHNFDTSAADLVKEEVDLAADTFINDIEVLLAAIGIPDENLMYKRNQVRKALITKKASLKNIQLIRNRIGALVKLINDNTKVTEEIEEEKKTKLTPEEAEWSIASLGSGGMTMSSKKMKIKLAETEVEKLTMAFGDNDIVVLRGQGGKKFSFRPFRKGNENAYIVKQMDDDTYPNGILLDASSIDIILSNA